MKRIMSDRGMGKTTSLLNYAKQLANSNPDVTIFFGCENPNNLCNMYKDNLPSNIKFISILDILNGATRGRKCKIVIDEIESLLNRLQVDAYTLTLSYVEW